MIHGKILPGSKVLGKLIIQWAPIRNDKGVAIEFFFGKNPLFQGVILKENPTITINTEDLLGTLLVIFGENPSFNVTDLKWKEGDLEMSYSGVIKEW